MICNSKSEFLTGLRLALEKNNISDTRDILTDFRQHFEDGEAAGESEAEVCRKLGDIDEIIKQYISEDAERKASEPDSSGFGAETGADPGNAGYNTAPPPPRYGNVQYGQQASFSPDGGKIAGIIILDVLVYSWALPALAGVIVGLMGMALSFAGSGIAVFFGGILGFFVDISGFIATGLVPASLVFLGLMFMSFGGMLVIASIASVKGFINISISIVNHHAKIFTGHNIWNKIGKNNKEVQAQ